jgi:seryl-tRNA synthetase
VGGEDAARLIKEVGSKPDHQGVQPKDHMALGSALDLIDFETAAIVSGAKCDPHHGITVIPW